VVLVEKKRNKTPFISIIIPAYNAEKTIAICLESIFSSSYKDFEIIVVNDGSKDTTLQIIKDFPVVIIDLESNQGPSIARNEAVKKAKGTYLFFTDADCIFSPCLLNKTSHIAKKEIHPLFGGTYAVRSCDQTFFSDFQSIFIHFFETRYEHADYIATHFLVMKKKMFMKSGGFASKEYLGRKALKEDVEFTQRMKKQYGNLKIYSTLTVKHIFNFNLYSSLENAFKKSYGWARISLETTKDLAADSGVGSVEIKVTVGLLAILLLLGCFSVWNSFLLLFCGVLFMSMLLINRPFLTFVFKKRGFVFGIASLFYYVFPYSFFVGLGGSFAIVEYFFKRLFR
jgi:glycosyltransferase involved in cell wall biosynthesis